MKKLLFVLFLIGLLVMSTWTNEDKQKQKEHNVQLIEQNIKNYLD